MCTPNNVLSPPNNARKPIFSHRGWEMVRDYGIWNGEDPSKGVVSINTKHHMSVSSTARPKRTTAWKGNGNWMLLVSDPDPVSGQGTHTPAAVSTGNSKANGEVLFSPRWGFPPGKLIMLQHRSRSWLSNPEGHRVPRLRKQKAPLSSGWEQLCGIIHAPEIRLTVDSSWNPFLAPRLPWSFPSLLFSSINYKHHKPSHRLSF